MRVLLTALSVYLLSAAAAMADGKTRKPETPEQAAARFVKELTARVAEVGYQNVRLAPHLFILFAEKKDGTHVAVIVNTETMQAMEVENDSNFKELAGSSPETFLPRLH